MADVLKLYGDLAAGSLALTWAILVVLDGRIGKALGKLVASPVALAFSLAALGRWYATYVGALVLALFLTVAGACAHVPTVAEGTKIASATAAGIDTALQPLATDEAAKARELLAEIVDALELLEALAPALDAELAARRAEVQP